MHQLGAEVVGVSPDTPAALRKFADREALPFPLLADADRAVLDRYGLLKEKMMYGRRVTGVVRTTLLLDPQGCLRRLLQPVKPQGHGRQVLEALAELQVQPAAPAAPHPARSRPGKG